MITLTRQGLLLTLSASVIPSQGSSDVPVAVVNDINTYVGYTLEPRVGYYLNGIYKSTVCTYDTSAKTFSVPAEAFKQIGIIDITLALIDNANANHIETCQTVHATVNKAPLGTVVLPDQTTWQDYVNSYMNQLFDSNYKPQFDQIQQDLENLVTEAQQQQQTAEQQQTQIDNAISVMGEYQIVSNDPVQIQFKQGDGTFGPTVDLGDGLASKSMVNAGYYQSIGSQYSGSASDYGIQVEEIVGAYSQGLNPSPDNPQEMQAVEISELHSVGKNLFDKSQMQDNTGTTIVYLPIQVGEGSFTCVSDIPYYPYGSGQRIANIFLLSGNVTSGVDNLTNGVDAKHSITVDSTNGYVTIAYRSTTESENVYNPKDYKVLVVETKKQDTVTLDEPLVLRALPNGVCDTYENGVITRRVGVVEFDGSVDESWAKNDGADYTYHITLSDIALEEVSDGNDILSDRFIAKRSNTILSSGEFRRGGGNTVGNNILVFRYDGLATDDLTAWRTWIKSNPVTVWYELATPTTEQLAIPTLQSFYPFTNAWCDSVVQPQQIAWNVLTGKSSILDGNGNLIQQGYMTPQDNFFDNADYRQGAINQRGETSYTTSGAKTYTIDGWYIENSGSNLGVGTSFISVVGTFGRRINIVKENETYLAFTIQINLEKAQTIVIDTTTLNEGQDYTYQVDDNITFGIFFFSGQNYAWTYITCINNANIDFMKLERGHKFTGMPVWNYALEYLKCCRLLYVWHLPEIPSHGYNNINNLSYFTGTAFPVPFASTPTWTVKQLLMDQVDVSSDLNTINVTPNRCTSISLTGQISTISGTIIFSNELI